jgi:dTDP-4-amino-4,6-dideoxygalactose transaminase
MIPRGTPDIQWRDLWAGLVRCLRRDDPLCAQAGVEAAWAPEGDALACLSVRSGFDLLLQELALPVGSEVLLSAVTIPGMLEILEHHGLVPIPLDIDPHTLDIDAGRAAQLIGPRTRAILVAHLFGSRITLDPIMRVARRHTLLLIEDCAQAYDGSSYRGHAGSDVSMFSFGPIKTATALGGALLRVHDRALLERMRQRQACFARQPQLAFARRLALFALLKLLARPTLFSPFVALCRLRGVDHDRMLSRVVRGFGAGSLIERIRRQPSAPLLRLLARRVAQAHQGRIARRVALARRVAAALPGIARPGTGAACHAHWIVPIISRDPGTLVRLLWAQGFDATRTASSLISAAPPAGRPAPVNARRMLEQLVYLPVYQQLGERDIQRLARIINDFESGASGE